MSAGATINIIFESVKGRYSRTLLYKAVEECLERLDKQLGLPDISLEIEVYGTRQEWIDNHTRLNESELLTWVCGDSGRIIRVVADKHKVVTDSDLGHMVCHECVHQSVRSYTGPTVPAWLDEGLAVMLVQELPASYLAALSRALEQNALLPFELLDQTFSRFDRSLKSLVYAQGSSLVQFIVEKYGYSFVRLLLDGCCRGDRIEFVLKQKGLTLYLLEKEWSLWLPAYLSGCFKTKNEEKLARHVQSTD